MPIYEYKCADCGRKFDILQKFEEVGQSAPCPSCNNKADKIPSTFFSHNKPTYCQKKKEDLAEHIEAIEQRKEREPHLNWDKHLKGAKKEIAGERAFKKEIRRVAGKDSGAPQRYREIMKAKEMVQRQDNWGKD